VMPEIDCWGGAMDGVTKVSAEYCVQFPDVNRDPGREVRSRGLEFPASGARRQKLVRRRPAAAGRAGRCWAGSGPC